MRPERKRERNPSPFMRSTVQREVTTQRPRSLLHSPYTDAGYVWYARGFHATTVIAHSHNRVFSCPLQSHYCIRRIGVPGNIG
jgi:hypothetical protein